MRRRTRLRRSGRAVLVATAACLAAAGCAGLRGGDRDPDAPVLRIAGSDTLLPLVERWTDAWGRAHPDVRIEVRGGGTGRGIEALVAGEADLCSASRPMHPGEVRRLLEARGFLGLGVLVAKDAVTVFVHRGNVVRDLSLDELGAIFRGEVRNWREVGGKDRTMVRLGRPVESGTRAYLEDRLGLAGAWDPAVEEIATTRGIVREVSRRPWAIGYGGMAYGRDVVHIAVEGVDPTEENVRTGEYPLSRYLYLLAPAPPEGPIRDFLDWVLGDEGQRVVADVGYVPLWAPDSPVPAGESGD